MRITLEGREKLGTGNHKNRGITRRRGTDSRGGKLKGAISCNSVSTLKWPSKKRFQRGGAVARKGLKAVVGHDVAQRLVRPVLSGYDSPQFTYFCT